MRSRPLRFVFFAALLSLTLARVSAAEPKELREARREFDSLTQPTELDRVRYLTRLVRLRETFTRADYKIMKAIDAELLRHPMPATEACGLARRLAGRWQSPRRPYFYHADGTWVSDEDTSTSTGGRWRIEGNQFFQDYRGQPASSGETIILLTETDFVYGDSPFYLRRGTSFPWR